MFPDISWPFALALLFITTSICYFLVGASTYSADVKSKTRQRYMLTCVWLAMWSLFFGMMTVADNEETARLFWSLGFLASSLFFPQWVLFLSYLTTFALKRVKYWGGLLFALSIAFSFLCVTSERVTFVKTKFGYQFSYGGSLLFKVAVVYFMLLVAFMGVFHVKWLLGARFTRQKRQSLLFLLLTYLVAPPGFFLDFVNPAFFSRATVVPLASVLILIVTFQLFSTMRKHNTMNITLRNVSEHIFKSVNLPVLVLDDKNRVVLANSSAFDFWDYDIIGRNMAELVFQDNSAPEQAFFKDSFSSAIITAPEQNGPRICDMLLTVVRDKYGDILSKIVVLTDITDMQNALYEAVEASRAKGDFLSRMSHEIRTPMNAIIGMTKIGQASGDVHKMQYCLNKISDASKHLLGILNDILDMSKIEANKLDIISEPFNFEKMLENISTVVAIKAEEKKLNLFIYVDPEAPVEVLGDELRLTQVITNFLSNAIKFTPDYGNVHLGIKLMSRESADESTILVEVVDDGIGISPEQQEKIFSSFEQAEGNTARRFGGTGLGLAISKRIVELMGGTVGISSAVGQGSRFYFTIKIKHADKPYERTKYDKSLYRNLRVLVVDDTQDVLDFFARVLADFNIPCDLAANGPDAVELVNAAIDAGEPYHILFVDYLMDDMNGIETARRIRSVAGDSMNVIMISASDWNIIQEEAAAAGIVRFIQKPLFRSSIFNAINELVIHQETLARPDTKLFGAARPTFSKCTILLAEDIEINREIALTLLEETGVTIDCVENGSEAVRAFSENQDRYDLVLMDVQMPLMDGLEATRRIRALGTAQAGRVPIIAMTANAFKEDVELCKSAGMVDHIGKPIDADKLVEKVAEYLSGKED